MGRIDVWVRTIIHKGENIEINQDKTSEVTSVIPKMNRSGHEDILLVTYILVGGNIISPPICLFTVLRP